MDKFVNFLLDYYLWILGVLVILIITIIGFLVDSKQKRKKRESEVTVKELPKEEVNSVINEQNEAVLKDNTLDSNINYNNSLDKQSVQNSDVLKENNNGIEAVNLLSNQKPHIEPREVNIPFKKEENNGLLNQNLANSNFSVGQQMPNSGQVFSQTSEPSVINTSSQIVTPNGNGLQYQQSFQPNVIYAQSQYQSSYPNVSSNNQYTPQQMYQQNIGVQEVVPKPVQAVPINNSIYNNQSVVSSANLYHNSGLNSNYVTNNNGVIYPNVNSGTTYALNGQEMVNNNQNTVNNQNEIYKQMGFVTGENKDDKWSL